ncbi:unnamed protein product [Caenorhabditis angaria]|uniref:Uncharacterized protein n=1 Tax=Caenorhabditis angaria TaxID=860376 RepID=A0A9P1J153_9PELO|nr:unnamed protein product [Caenorhabditis angaria]
MPSKLQWIDSWKRVVNTNQFQYILCVNGIQQAAVCQKGFVFYENQPILEIDFQHCSSKWHKWMRSNVVVDLDSTQISKMFSRNLQLNSKSKNLVTFAQRFSSECILGQGFDGSVG